MMTKDDAFTWKSAAVFWYCATLLLFVGGATPESIVGKHPLITVGMGTVFAYLLFFRNGFSHSEKPSGSSSNP